MQWPASWREWLPGFALSVPVVALLLLSRLPNGDADPSIAALAVLLSIPWIVPVFVLVTALSAPVYAWLHTQGPVIDVLGWLGHCVLIATVIGTHINAAFAVSGWRARHNLVPESGLGEFLSRTQRH